MPSASQGCRDRGRADPALPVRGGALLRESAWRFRGSLLDEDQVVARAVVVVLQLRGRSAMPCTKPRLMNQCEVRVVSTNRRLAGASGRATPCGVAGSRLRLSPAIPDARSGRPSRPSAPGEVVQRGAAVDHAVVLQHGEVLDALDHAGAAPASASSGSRSGSGWRRRRRWWPGAGPASSTTTVPTPSGEDLQQHAAVQREGQQVRAGYLTASEANLQEVAGFVQRGRL